MAIFTETPFDGCADRAIVFRVGIVRDALEMNGEMNAR